MSLAIATYQMSGSELWSKKVELTHTLKWGYRESLHKTKESVITPTKTSLATLIVIS